MSKLEKRKYKINLEGFITPKNHDEFVTLLKDVTNDEYEIISKFSMMNGYCKFLHKKCGGQFRSSPYKLLIEGEGCFDCKDKINIKPILYKNKNKHYIKHAKFVNDLYETHKHEYAVLGIYQAHHHPVKIVHTKCGEIFERKPEDILNTIPRCPKCNPVIQWTLGKVKKEVIDLTNSEFEVVSRKKFKNMNKPIEIKHNVCGKIFTESPNIFLQTPKCGICELDMSLEEKCIKDFLVMNKIQFEREYSLDGCKNIQLLKFDFAIFKKNKIICLLEYDGVRHYYPINGEESFINAQINDDIKNSFCKDNKIKLIRIPFWEKDNLDKILKREMELVNLL